MRVPVRLSGFPLSTDLNSNFKVRILEIDPANAARRIDNFLIASLKGVPKSRIYRMIRSGEVRVNSGRAKAEYRLKAGDLVRIPPLRISESPPKVIPPHFLKHRLDDRILYEDNDLLVLDKPFGIAVHGGSGLSFGLIEGLRELRSDTPFLELVHRLDRDTSGCLLIAKKRSALKSLHESFRSEQVRKSYSALLSGSLPHKRITVDQPLRKNVKKSGERMVQISADGKASQTEFLRKRRFANATLVEALPKSGRTHQIRVHAASLGFPIAGDERYGDFESNRLFRKLGMKRLFLHASKLAFEHPRSGQNLLIEAPLDEALTRFLEKLSNETSA